MLSIEAIMNMTAEDVQLFNALSPMVNSAIEFEKIIKNCYTFRIGEKEKVVIGNEDSSKRVVLTHEGIAKFYENNKLEFEIECEFKTIFELLKANYLFDNGFVKPCITKGNPVEVEKNKKDSDESNYSEADREIVKKANQYSRFLEFLVKSDNTLKMEITEARR